MEIISRKRWGARYKAGFGARALPTRDAWLHHTVAAHPDLAFRDLNGDALDDDEVAAMRQVEAIGQSRFGAGVSYNLVVMPSGRIYEGCGVDRVGAHTAGRNTTAMGIALAGDYSNRVPAAVQVDALVWLLQQGAQNGWLDAPKFDGGHRDLKSTSCPGAKAYALIPEINRRAALAAPVITDPGPAPTSTTPTSDPEDTMQYQAIQRASDGAIALTAPGYFLHVSPEFWAVAQRTAQAKPPGQALNDREWDVARAIALGGEEPESERAAD